MALVPPLQVSVTPETKARIEAVASSDGLSQAQVIRDIIDAGLVAREAQSKALTESSR